MTAVPAVAAVVPYVAKELSKPCIGYRRVRTKRGPRGETTTETKLELTGVEMAVFTLGVAACIFAAMYGGVLQWKPTRLKYKDKDGNDQTLVINLPAAASGMGGTAESNWWKGIFGVLGLVLL